MTEKHRERIVNLLHALDDYKYQAEFAKTDVQLSEYNAIDILQNRLRVRLRDEPVEED